MPKKPQEFADLLGARIVGDVPDIDGGPFGMAQLAHVMHKRLTAQQGETARMAGGLDAGEAEVTVTQVIASVPLSFDLPPFAGRWFSWVEINACFWPGRGGRASTVNPLLAPVRDLGGVYLIAWSADPPPEVSPSAVEVRYIGESVNFNQRMGGFGNSAGFWGKRRFGHSAGWRWPEGQSEHTWVAFFPVGDNLLPHLATGLRKWLEAVALEEHRLACGQLPEINGAEGEIEFGKA